MFDSIWKLREHIGGGTIAHSDDIVDTLLKERDEECDREAFMNPLAENLTDPFLIPDMDVAVERLLRAADDGEHVMIFGDYDADGITATAILLHFLLNYLDMHVDFMLPNRFGDGYGLSKRAIDEMVERGTDILLTCDNGIVAFEEVEYAIAKGLEVIVTDHHTPGETIPSCTAVVNPMREDSKFPTRQLCGAGVAFKLVEAISGVIGIEEYTEYLPIAAIGTIGDSMPLIGENRIIVKCGLEKIDESIFPGVVAISALAKGKSSGRATVRMVSFGIVPRLNAAGRMDDATMALNVLLAADDEEAQALLRHLDSLNEERKQIESEVYKEAIEDEHIVAKDGGIVISYGENWHPGVVGIVCSRLVEKYSKPAIVFAGRDEDPENPGTFLVRGSARSVENVNLHSVLSDYSDLFVKFGGHAMAAGLTVTEANMVLLAEKLSHDERLTCAMEKNFASKSADFVLPPELISLETAEKIKAMEPFGVGNEQPVFISTGFTSVSASRIGEEKKHLRIRLISDRIPGGEVYGVSFNNGTFEKMINTAGPVAIMYTLEVDEWNGNKKPSLMIMDVADSGDFKTVIDNNSNVMYTNMADYFRKIIGDAFSFSRDELALLYRMFRSFGGEFTFDDLFEKKLYSEARNLSLPWFKIRYALEIFSELGLISRPSKGKFAVVAGQSQKIELDNSATFRCLKRG